MIRWGSLSRPFVAPPACAGVAPQGDRTSVIDSIALRCPPHSGGPRRAWWGRILTLSGQLRALQHVAAGGRSDRQPQQLAVARQGQRHGAAGRAALQELRARKSGLGGAGVSASVDLGGGTTLK